MYIDDLPSVSSDVNVQIYADDMVVCVNGKNKDKAASKLSAVMVQVTTWLVKSCFQLNVTKTPCSSQTDKP